MIGLFIVIAIVIAAYLDIRRLRYQRITQKWMRMDLQRTRIAARRRSKEK